MSQREGTGLRTKPWPKKFDHYTKVFGYLIAILKSAYFFKYFLLILHGSLCYVVNMYDFNGLE